MARQGLANTFGLPMDKVRVQAAPIGGAFGGKLMISEPLAAAAALKLRRPVRIVFSRREDFAAANPAPGQLIELELGATADGALTAIRGRIVGDRGGLGDMGVEAISTMLSAGPYRWPAHDLTALGVSTNRVSPGAYRAPGAPPAAFAVETLMDELARRAGPRPDRPAAAERARSPATRASTARRSRSSARASASSACASTRCAQRRDELPDGEGVGVALGFWPGGLEPAAAICKLDSDGRLTVVTAAADMSGIENAFIAIAAETFGLARGQRPRHHGRHRSSAPYGGVAGGSQGHLHVRARGRARGRGGARAAARRRGRRSWRSRPRTSSSSTARCARSARPRARISIADLAAKTYTFGGPHAPIEGYGGERAGQPRARRRRRT